MATEPAGVVAAMSWLKQQKGWFPKPPVPERFEASRERPVQVDLPPKALLRLDEVADICEVHINTVRRWIDEGFLTCVIVGKQKRIPREALVAFFRQKPS